MGDNKAETTMPAAASTSTTASKAGSKNMMLMVGGVLVAIVCVVVLGLAVFLGKGLLGGDEGISIPDSFEKYKAEGFTFGFPEDWEASGSYGIYIAGSEKFDLAANPDKGTFVIMLNSDNADNSEEDLENVIDGKCKDVIKGDDTSDSLGSFADVDEDDIKNIKSTKINGKKACKADFKGKTTEGVERDVEGTVYFIAASEDVDDGGIAAIVISIDDNNLDDGKKVARTIEFEEEDKDED